MTPLAVLLLKLTSIAVVDQLQLFLCSAEHFASEMQSLPVDHSDAYVQCSMSMDRMSKRQAHHAQAEKGHAAIALAGGSTPAPVYRRLAKADLARFDAGTDKPKVLVDLVDQGGLRRQLGVG